MRLVYFAFIEVRAAGLNGDAKHAAAIAEAFHNLPMHLADLRPICLRRLREDIIHLRKLHPMTSDAFDYIGQLDALGFAE